MAETKAVADLDAAVAFLAKWSPAPWVLTAIEPDKRAITATFDSEAAVRAWIKKYVGKRNIYFQPNPIRSSKSKKTTKEDIERMDWLWVDMDPRPAEKDYEAERARAVELLRKFEPTPTVLVSSGNGIQAFWRLEQSKELQINGDATKAEELEAYNVQLERVLDADPCHNVDRIMRLPGTLNIQNKSKAKKYGPRGPVLATLLEFNDHVYPIKDFEKATQVQTGSGGSLKGGSPTVKISSNVAPVLLEDLPATVSDRTKMLILHGNDPEEPGKWESRSECLFHVCCQLVREKCPDDTIYAVIMDHTYGISGHILDQADSHKAALKNIRSAREHNIDPHLAGLNDKHAVISDIGGKCRIISEVYDDVVKRFSISAQSFPDFMNRYRNQRIKVGEKKGVDVMKPLGQWWADHPERRQFERMVFAPGLTVGPDVYNLWQGFRYKSLPGDKHFSYLAHIKDNLCCGNETNYQYFLRWMARAVQKPACAGEVAVVLRGKRGTGKGVLAKHFGKLFGAHFVAVADSKHLTGNFNAHLRDAVVVFADEAFYAGDSRHEGVLKSLITEEWLSVEAKGVDIESAQNFVHLIMASNSDWVVPAGPEERRFFILDVGDFCMRNFPYFKQIATDLEDGGYENLLHFLINFDLSDFDVRAVPQTTGLQEQKIRSLAPQAQWWLDKLMTGEMIRGHDDWVEPCPIPDLYEDYIRTMRDMGVNRRHSVQVWAKYFIDVISEWSEGAKKVRVKKERMVYDSDGNFEKQLERIWYYKFPSLNACRQSWQRKYGVTDWPQEVTEDEPPQQDVPF